jgi:hypothetical protein
MSRRKHEHDDRRELARRALRDSTEGAAPDMERLLASAPSLVDEARRRRAQTVRDPIADLVPMAWAVLPRLAAVAAALVLVSAAFYVREIGVDLSEEPTASGGVDVLLLTGGLSDESGDPLLEALLGEENGNG